MDDTAAQPFPQRIAQLEAELAAARREMHDFTYTVSHDLRAPLRHIVSYSQLVQEDAGPQLTTEVQGFLGTISDSANNLGAMLDALLDLSRVGTMALHCTIVPLQPLVQETVDALTAKQGQPMVTWRIDAGLPSVVADVHLLGQALQQVLANALQFTANRDGAAVEISASRDISHGTVTLTIRDNGIGFAPEYANQLFQPFKRLHTARQGAGVGMGLALTRKLVERLEGTARIAGVMDGGCTVMLTLPDGGVSPD